MTGMRKLGFAAAFLLAGVPLLAADIVLVLETGAGMERYLAPIRVPVIPAGDRVALMTLGGKPRLRQKFTSDQTVLDGAIGRATVAGIHVGPWSGIRTEAPVYKAITAACKLFDTAPPGKRAVIILFGSEDRAPSGEAVRAVAAAHASVYPVAVSKVGPPDWGDKARTPPTVPGRMPGQPGLLPLPEATLKTLTELARVSGGEAFTGRFDLPKLIGLIGQ